MSFFAPKKNAKTALQAKPPVIRKVLQTVTVPKHNVVAPSITGIRDPYTGVRNRRLPPPTPHPRVAQVARSRKRQSSSPSDRLFGSSSEDGAESDSAESQVVKKRRISDNICQRKIRAPDDETVQEPGTLNFVHGGDLTTGARSARFRPAFGLDDPFEIQLQYPSRSQKERFLLVQPREAGDYDPIADIVSTVSLILARYLPAQVSAPLLDPSTGLVFRLRRAYNHVDLEAFKSAIKEFNAAITANLLSSNIANTLDSTYIVATSLTERILAQIYSRTVSPQVDKLRRYEAASDNVYGELLPGFVSQILRDTKLTPQSVFLDLGSGVGNVVLQAALEMGCQSYGIEQMGNPAGLARLQAGEFPARARLWGLAVGTIELIHGDFLEHPRCSELIKLADVILINNQAFSPQLNGDITRLFLDLKDGARVVSLKSFVPSGWKFGPRTNNDVLALLDVERKEYWKGCVSWTDEGGEYFISTKGDYNRVRTVPRKEQRTRRRV